MFAKNFSTASPFAASPRPTYFSANSREIGQMSKAGRSNAVHVPSKPMCPDTGVSASMQSDARGSFSSC